MDSARSILLLDSNEQSAQQIQRFLKAGAFPFVVNHTQLLKDGITSLREDKPDLILLDAQMARATGFEIFNQIAQSGNIPLILLSDSGGAETKKQAELLHASDYMVKNKINLLHLQKAILSTLKTTEATVRLDHTFTEFNNRQDALLKMLDKTSAAVLVINEKDEVLYANPRAYKILDEESLKQHLAAYITYRPLQQDEELSLKHGPDLLLNIKISSTVWNGANANLFVIERKQQNDATSALALKVLQPVLNTLDANILILNMGVILFANSPALKHLVLSKKLGEGALLNTYFKLSPHKNEGTLVVDLFKEKETTAWLKQADGSMVEAKLFTKPLSIGEYLFEICWFVLQAGDKEGMMPGSSSDSGSLSNDSILQLASHDLREPVRTMLNYIQLISDNLQKNNYESVTEYIGFAKTEAQRMEKLLTDFKAFIGLKEHKLKLTKVSVKAVLGDVLNQLKPAIEASKAELNMAELPEVNADRELLHLLLYNLIDNSLKFIKKGKKPSIDIGIDKFDGKLLFCVRDNGIGIAKKYHEKVFEMFERLNRVDEYNGNGLGLAICQKIVEMHGGKIWVESLPGVGSSFYFTLNTK